jgi:hypothetical protein
MSLIVLAILGTILHAVTVIAHGDVHVLPFWSSRFVSCGPFGFLEIMGSKVGLVPVRLEQCYVRNRRTPKQGVSEKELSLQIHVCRIMLLQTVAMLFLVALWVSIYEMLKVKHPDDALSFLQMVLYLIGRHRIWVSLSITCNGSSSCDQHGTILPRELSDRSKDLKALIRKLFLMDFKLLMWFFSLIFAVLIGETH